MFGPGNWGNTGRYAWDAVMVIINFKWLEANFWTGRYLVYKSSVWPDEEIDDFITSVAYLKLKEFPLQLVQLDFFMFTNTIIGAILKEKPEQVTFALTQWGVQTGGKAFDNWDWSATFAAKIR